MARSDTPRGRLAMTPEKRAGLCVLSGTLLAAAFPKLGFAPFAWVALVPLLFAIDGAGMAAVIIYGWIQGFVFFACSLYWIVIVLTGFAHKPIMIAVGTLALLAAVEAGFVAVAIGGAEFVSRRLGISRLVSFPVAWVSMEWLRSFFPIGFPWNLLGAALYRELRIIQFAEFTGVYGVSALIVFVNVAFWTMVSARPSRVQKVRAAWSLAVVFAIVFGFGAIRVNQLDRAPSAGTLRVGIIQANIPQSMKWNPASLPANFKIYSDATLAAAKEDPDVIIWPETATGFFFQPLNAYPGALARDSEYWTHLADLAKQIKLPILFGAPAIDIVGRDIATRNRAYVITRGGYVDKYYDKIELVPVAEYVPGPLRGHINRIVEGLRDFRPGDRQTIFQIGTARVAALICYEGIFPYLARRSAQAGANILVNITNDAWFGRSSAPYQLLAMTVMRAIENRTPIVRVANTGISAVISPTGRIIGATDLFTRTTEIETVAWNNERTAYTRFGDVFAWACFGFLLATLALAFVQRSLRCAFGKRRKQE